MLFVTVFPKDIALYEQSQRYSKLLAIPTNHHQLWQTLARIIPKKALPMIRRTVKNTAENAIPNCANDYSWILVNKSVIAGVTQSLEPNDVKDMLISDLYNIDQKQLSSKTLEKLSINVAHQELREYIKVYRAWATEAEANNAIGLFEVKLQEEGKEDIRKRLCRGARTGVDSLLKQIFNKPREEPLNDLALKEKRDSVHEQLCFAVFNALETGRFDKTKYVIDTGHMKKPVDLTEIFNEFISCRQAASLLSISFGRRELDHYKIHFTMGLNNISEHVIKHNT